MRRPETVPGILSLLAAAVLMFSTGTAYGDEFDWNADNNGNWNDGGNWVRTSGSTRDYPDDTTDIANLVNDITDERTVTIPGGGIDVDTATLGDTSDNFIITGGELRTQNGLTINDDTAVRIDSDVQLLAGKSFNGGGDSGLLVLNGDINSDRFGPTIADNELTLRFSGTINGTNTNNGNAGVSGTGTLEIATDGTLNQSPRGITTGRGAVIRTFGGDRAVTDFFNFSGANDTTFDGTNGDLQVGAAKFTGPSFFAGSAVIIRDGRITTTGNVSYSLDSNNQGAFIDLDTGELEITGSGNTYSADGDVEFRGSGSLILNNADGSATGTGNSLIIPQNIVLSGNGSTGSAVQMSGTVAPGNSINTLSTGAITFQSGSSYQWEFTGASADLLAVDGNVIIQDSSNFTIDALNLGPNGPDTIDLMTYTGSFTGDPDLWTVNLPPDFKYDTITSSGGTVQITGLTPEPTTAALLILAGLTLLTGRKRP